MTKASYNRSMKFKFSSLLLPASLLFGSGTVAQTTADQPLVITVDAKKTAQTIHNIGASGCWFSEGIGKYWPLEKRERMAELLFSKERSADGSPKGIGLSAWRFNIGGGTTEQGDSSGIKDFRKRVECFLNPDGTYDWNKQAGYQWFLRKAKAYGVENLIAFSNTPPVQFNLNGRGFKTAKDYQANLQPDKYQAYADFLSEVIKHFDAEGLHFNYISPVNEPQWDWSNKPGEASQEGSPWSNADIYKVTTALDASLGKKKLTSQIMVTEAGMLTYLYSGKSASSRQIQTFFDHKSPQNICGLKHVPGFIAGHSYFTDTNDSNMVAVRRHLADTAKKYGIEYWQSEYSMLGDGFREGAKGKRSQMDCALFLAKIINQDLTIGNAAAWQFWNSWEPGSPEWDTRYYLLALKPANDQFTDGDFTVTKNLWALGNYSLFIRPGMKRVLTSRNDQLDEVKAAQDVMVAAFTGGKDKLVMVVVNYTDEARSIRPQLKSFNSIKSYRTYTTAAGEKENLKPSAVQQFKGAISLLPRSVTTVIFN
ncbi:beta-glycosidase [Mucilaginibacter sp. RS28]|uniref:Beta-glycosidase n=1 Tax=Mucilaginibacter straminoryzae TaxID=2932774 RepID=A0A9X1X1N8_9SPHI|nr:glycoside hydrolase [Mucilaginibacter straminoryzae]MCJ8208986.1 beta-glycosidase [Mucilaginibacter straminoryzae]